MNMLVTGGAGFIGSYYVRAVLAGEYPAVRDARVTVLDRLAYAGNRANLAPVAGEPRLRFVEGDICDVATVSQIMTGHDVVVHFAAESHVDRSLTDPAAFVLTNVAGTQVLLDAAVRAGVGRFVHVSTDEVYGPVPEGACTESAPLAPTSPYAASKAASDLLALSWHRTFGLDVVITRCCNNYGPYQYPEKVIPLFITNLLDGTPVPLYGDGRHRRRWLHVADHCAGLQRVLEAGRAGGIYHIGADDELANAELAGRLLAACGAGWDMVRMVPDRQGHDRRYALDTSKIREELGFVPQIPFGRGLAGVVTWYRENRDWWEPLRAQPEPRAPARRGGCPRPSRYRPVT